VEELRSLLSDVRAGDLQAFGQIVRRFQDMAYGYAYSILGDSHLAEDATQEAFVQAYLQLSDLRDPDAFPGWFRRIVYKHCDRFTRRKGVPTVPLDAVAEPCSDALGPDEITQEREMKDAVLDAIRALPEDERLVTTLYYINGYSQKEVAQFLEMPATTVNNRLHASRRRLKERMMEMVEETLKGVSLPDDFADVVVRMVSSDGDLRRAVELMPSGSFESVAEAQTKEIFVVGEEGQVESAGHLGTTSLTIGSTRLKAARAGYGIAGESEGVPDPMFARGYQAHFKLARARGCNVVAVHGSQYDHALCGFVPCFYYPVVTLPCDRARSVETRAAVVAANEEQKELAEEAWSLDPYAPKMSAYIGGGAAHVVELDGRAVGYARVNEGFVPADHYGMPFGHVPDIAVQTRAAALAVIRRAGELAHAAGDSEIFLMQSHMTLVTQTILSLGGRYLLRPSCDLVGLDAEMIAIVDLANLTRELQREFQSRLSASQAHGGDGCFSIEMGGQTAGFAVRSGRLDIATGKQDVHCVLPRWLTTRLYMGYYSGEDALAMGPIPYDRSDGRTTDCEEHDMEEVCLPESEAAIFKALFPKLWPCATPDPDVWPWVMGQKHSRYRHGDEEPAQRRAQIDALRLPWIGY